MLEQFKLNHVHTDMQHVTCYMSLFLAPACCGSAFLEKGASTRPAENPDAHDSTLVPVLTLRVAELCRAAENQRN